MQTNLPTLFTQGGFPNALIRSALFSVKNLGDTRTHKANYKVAAQGQYEVKYTGEELNQMDAQVLYVAFVLQRESGLDIGSPITVNQTDFVNKLGRQINGEACKRASESLKRIAESSMTIVHGNRRFTSHVINDFGVDDNRHFTYTLNPNLGRLFEEDCTLLKLSNLTQLNMLLAKWLYNYFSSHSVFFARYHYEKLREMSGSVLTPGEFKRQLKLACDQIITTLGDKAPFVEYSLEKDGLHIAKTKRLARLKTSKAIASSQGDKEFDPFA